MGVCTVTPIKRNLEAGGLAIGEQRLVTINLSTTYATGGDSLTPASLGMPGITFVNLLSGVTTPAGHVIEVIPGANEQAATKLRVRDVATGVELTNGNDFSAQSVRAVVSYMPFV
jgi:hypothetical protein